MLEVEINFEDVDEHGQRTRHWASKENFLHHIVVSVQKLDVATIRVNKMTR